MNQHQDQSGTPLPAELLSATLPSVNAREIIAIRQDLVAALQNVFESLAQTIEDQNLVPGAAATIVALGFLQPHESLSVGSSVESPRRSGEEIVSNVLRYGLLAELEAELRELLPSQLSTLIQLGILSEQDGGFSLRVPAPSAVNPSVELDQVHTLLRRSLCAPTQGEESLSATIATSSLPTSPSRKIRKQLEGRLKDVEGLIRTLPNFELLPRYLKLTAEHEHANTFHVKTYQKLCVGEVPAGESDFERTMIEVYRTLQQIHTSTGTARKEAPQRIRELQGLLDSRDISDHIKLLRKPSFNLPFFASTAYRAAMNREVGAPLDTLEQNFPDSLTLVCSALRIAAEVLPDEAAFIGESAETLRKLGKVLLKVPKGNRERLEREFDSQADAANKILSLLASMDPVGIATRAATQLRQKLEPLGPPPAT